MFAIFTPPSGRGLVIPVFFSWFFWSSLAPNFRLAKKYLPVILVRLAFICWSFHERWCRQSLAIEWLKNPFEKCQNEDANELWKPPIRSCHYCQYTRASEKQARLKYSSVKSKQFSAVLVYVGKIFREISVEKYKEFKGRRCWRALEANDSSWH